MISPAKPLFSVFRYSSFASVSSRSISDSQSSAHVEHSPVVPHSSQRGAPHTSQCTTWSSGICFPQSVHLTIICSRFLFSFRLCLLRIRILLSLGRPSIPSRDHRMTRTFLCLFFDRKLRNDSLLFPARAQRIAYLNTNALQQLHTYFVGTLPRPYDWSVVSNTFMIDQGILEKTLEFAPGEWLMSSYIATGIENVPIFIRADNAENELEKFLSQTNK